MKTILLALSFLVTFLFSNHSLANLPVKIKQGMDYTQARKILLKSGWKIVVMNKNTSGKPVCYEFVGGEADCQGLFEIEGCTPTTISLCNAVFFDGKQTYLNVSTTGLDRVIDKWEKTNEKPEVRIVDYYSLSADLPIKIKPGMDYSQARKILIKSGWQTVVMNRDELGNPICADGIPDCKGQFEIEACASTGIAPCNMLFFDGKQTYLWVYTVEGPRYISGWSIQTENLEMCDH